MISNGIDDLQGLQWELLASLFIGWIIIYLILGKGLHQNGKVSLFRGCEGWRVYEICDSDVNRETSYVGIR